MNDLRKALADIGDIRQGMASGTLFRGFGPAVMAASGVLALATAASQVAWMPTTVREPTHFLAIWFGAAVIAALLIGAEMLARTHRHHRGLADAMIMNAVEHFVPAGAAGAALGVFMVGWAPEAAWMLPGLWQLLVSVGIFASVRFLPRTVSLAGAWYFLSGLTCLLIAAPTHSLSPWAMGVPFGLGQLLLAAILFHAFGADHD